MTIDLRTPNMQTAKPEEAIREIQNYLFQLQQELSFALTSVDNTMESMQQKTSMQITEEQKKNTPAKTFGRIKELIIKSADIVDSYSEKITQQLEGRFVAESDFGTFQQETHAFIEQTDENFTQVYNNWQLIEGSVEELELRQLQMDAYIRTGKIYEDEQGVPRYGVEIGEQQQKEGAVVFQKFARLTSDKLSFFDENENEIAYISDRKMHITEAECTKITTDAIETRQIIMGEYMWNLGSDGHLTLM